MLEIGKRNNEIVPVLLKANYSREFIETTLK